MPTTLAFLLAFFTMMYFTKKFTFIALVLCQISYVRPLSSHRVTRRDAMVTGFGVSAAAFLPVAPAVAGTAPPTMEELARVREGYKGIKYLLANFEQETTVCRENGGECKRDAEPIRKALGLRSTTDPLFGIEKVFIKVKNMDIDPDKLEAFFEASEEWNSAMNMSNSMGKLLAGRWALTVRA